jgi:hypothetical protein
MIHSITPRQIPTGSVSLELQGDRARGSNRQRVDRRETNEWELVLVGPGFGYTGADRP